jgi:hypothetical protein
VLHSLPMPLDAIILIILCEQYNYDAPSYAVFYKLVIFDVSYVPPLMSDTKFQTHTEPQENL